MQPKELPEGTIVKIAETAEEIRAAKTLEYETFLGENYVTSNEDHEVLEYRDYDDQSDFFIVVEASEVVGVLRRIRGSMKTIEDFTLPTSTLEKLKGRTQELGTGAVRRDKRGTPGLAYIAALFRAVWQDSLRSGVQFWVFSLDKRIFHLVTKWFKFEIEELGPGVDYMGSFTIPAMLDIQLQKEVYKNGKYPEIGTYFLRSL